MFGFLVINKPQNITSRAALDVVARLIEPVKVGHAGTLDPLATGVLVACIGPATRLTRYVQRMHKTYRGGFRLGLSSPTEDIEGELTEIADQPVVTANALAAVLPNFVGQISQVPPQFSALKVKGKRAYDLARKGKKVPLKPRTIEVSELQLTQFEYPDFELLIRCGSGTYVRSLGRDIAVAMGSSAVMTRLTRAEIGPFGLANAIELEGATTESIEAALIPPVVGVSELERIELQPADVEGLLFGTPLELPGRSVNELAAVDQRGRLMAVLKRRKGILFSPHINFVQHWSVE